MYELWLDGKVTAWAIDDEALMNKEKPVWSEYSQA